jgi:hypothetical protein
MATLILLQQNSATPIANQEQARGRILETLNHIAFFPI